MIAKVLFPTKRASGLLASAVALLLILPGLLWAIAGAEPDTAAGAERNAVHSTGFSAAPLAPHVLQDMWGQGKTFKDPAPASANRGKKFNPQGEPIGPLTLDPMQKVLVIFVEFTTLPPGGPATRLDLYYFDDLLFGTVYDPPEYAPYPGHPTNRTLKNYYQEVSYGQMDVVTLNLPSTLGWAQCGKPYDYYCRADGIHDNGFGPYPENAQGLVIDAIQAVDPLVDFSQYAVNGEVPNLLVVHGGTDANWSSDPSLIWPHQWDLSDGTGLDGYWADGVKIDLYAMAGEVGGDLTAYWTAGSGPFPPTVGMFAHEWGHVLSLPDEYDYGYESSGTGMYGLMSWGSWGWWCPDVSYPDNLMFLGNSPTHYGAWSKYRAGFVTPIRVEPGTPVSVVLPPVELEPVIYRMDVPNSGGREYFLLENRQRVGFDQGLQLTTPHDPNLVQTAGHGLAIWHIDDTVLTRNYWRPNEAENWKEFRSEGWRRDKETGETHYGISVIQADDEWHLERAAWWGGDPADLYPGSLGVTSFGSDTFPNSSSYYFWPGSPPPFGYSGVTVSNIMETDGVITADLSFAQ